MAHLRGGQEGTCPGRHLRGGAEIDLIQKIVDQPFETYTDLREVQNSS